MTTRVSFAQYFKLAPELLALDRELDAAGCPVAYRKYVGAELLKRSHLVSKSANLLLSKLAKFGLDPKSILSVWYNNVYGHVVYQPPASRFLAMAVPVPIVVTWSPGSSSVTLPDITLLQFELKETLAKALDINGPLISGLKSVQALPLAKWVWLVMADFDTSVSSFEHARPAYHLSLWHSQQCLEKLLKAVLLARGQTEQQVQRYGHRAKKILEALSSLGVNLSSTGTKLVNEIFELAGGPAVRYVDDSPDPVRRLDLARRALLAHHLLLEFFASDCEKLGTCLAADANEQVIPGINIKWNITDVDLRRAVHLEHQSMCSHTLHSAPPYAERRDVIASIHGSIGDRTG